MTDLVLLRARDVVIELIVMVVRWRGLVVWVVNGGMVEVLWTSMFNVV